ncbi:SRPBCC family protein [Leifsonia sp. YIM 134122]|uniref:SRPBCC family protein n=1 Tax=Leifsonia stereocauli TaxID=3134136 RepID=A0ABU9W8X5_9MICO
MPTRNLRLITVRSERRIPLDSSTVWSMLADHRFDAIWREGVEEMTQDTTGTVRNGTRTVEQFRMLGQRMTNTAIISRVDPGVAFSWATTSGTDADGERRIEPFEGGVRVVLTTTSRPGSRMERMLSPLIGSSLQRSLDRSLERFEDLVLESAHQR